MNPSRILVSLLLLAGLGAGGYWFYTQSNQDPVPVPEQPNRPPTQQQPVENNQNNTASGTTNPVGPAPTDPNRDVVVANNTNDDAPQGVKGRVLLPDGSPAGNVPLFLLESMMNDPIKVFLMSKAGNAPPPVSSGATAEDGTFALGARAVGKSYDLRISSDFHPEVNHQSIKVRSEDWFDTGDITLESGIVLNGRVIDETSKAGIPEATVYLANNGNSHSVLPTPGRERGLIAFTDQTGAFRFTNAPSKGIMNITAEAPGYASATLNNQVIGQTNDFVLAISRGQPIAGVVVDSNGEPLPNVKVTAQGLSQKTPQNESTTTNGKGVFQFPSLREGPYTLNAASNAYAEVQAPPVMTGDLEVKLVMQQRPWVKLAVTSANNRPIKAYRISLKRHFPNNPLGIGNVPEFRDRRITPADYREFGDWAVIRGLPAGEFVFQIQDRNHAKSLSQPFEVREGGAPAEVLAKLTMGAAITGTVVDDSGKPVRGAVITTDMNNALPSGGGIFDLFKSMIPERHSKAQARTDRAGKFRLSKLAFADYMVRVSHADFCEGIAMNITLTEEGQIYDAGVVQLKRGTIVEGYTTIGGQAAGQIKVTLSRPQPEQNVAPGVAPKPTPISELFSASVVSDNSGYYRLLKRVPPGNYKVVAARQSGQQDPFMTLLDMRETERIVTLAPGQDRIKIDFDVPAR